MSTTYQSNSPTNNVYSRQLDWLSAQARRTGTKASLRLVGLARSIEISQGVPDHLTRFSILTFMERDNEMMQGYLWRPSGPQYPREWGKLETREIYQGALGVESVLAQITEGVAVPEQYLSHAQVFSLTPSPRAQSMTLGIEL